MDVFVGFGVWLGTGFFGLAWLGSGLGLGFRV